jgi:hypothetical protein
MPRVGFEPTIPVLEQEKIHVLDCAATAIGPYSTAKLKVVNVIVT